MLHNFEAFLSLSEQSEWIQPKICEVITNTSFFEENSEKTGKSGCPFYTVSFFDHPVWADGKEKLFDLIKALQEDVRGVVELPPDQNGQPHLILAQDLHRWAGAHSGVRLKVETPAPEKLAQWSALGLGQATQGLGSSLGSVSRKM